MKYTTSQALEILVRTPDVLESLLLDLSDEWIYQTEGGTSWSPYDVVGHLIHGERTDWIPRLAIILGDTPNKTFSPFDREAQFEESKGKSLKELLAIFRAERTQNLEKLNNIPHLEELLDSTGVHPDLGKVTLRQLLATWVVHDLGHIQQIARVMAKNYTHEVGPWKAYLGVLSR